MKPYIYGIKTKELHFFVVSLAIFLINPLISILFLGGVFYTNKTKQSYLLMSVYISLYMGLINTTKIPESDLINYLSYFNLAQTTEFPFYLAFFGKEIVFFGGTYILSHLLMNSEKLYIITMTFLIYFPILIAIYKFWIRCDDRVYIVLFAVCLLIGYQTFFGYSAHLIRQMIAGSFFIYFLINKALNGKNSWVLMIFAILIHTSSVVLFALAFIPYINKKLNTYRFIIVSIFISIVFITWDQLLSTVGIMGSGIGAVEYGLERVTNLNPDDQRDFVVGGSFFNRTLIPLSLLAVALSAYIFKPREKKMYLVINFGIMIIAILELFRSLGLHFLHVRYLAYSFFLFPFIYPYIFSYFKSPGVTKTFKILMIPINMLLIINLFRYTGSSRWEYANILDLVFQPVIMYLL